MESKHRTTSFMRELKHKNKGKDKGPALAATLVTQVT